ncbi:MAG: TonB-dependent receptor [Chitinophagaceae bacterium]
MEKRIFLLAGSWILMVTVVWAQSKTINGTVKSVASGELLIGAQVSLLEMPQATTTTNAYGFFSLTLPVPQDSVHLLIAKDGFKNDTIILNKNLATVYNISLLASVANLHDVVVTAQKNNIKKDVWGTSKLSTDEVSAVPVIFGEKDILKTLQLLPGIKSAGDGNSGFYVRGGGTDQNLLLLDDVPIYNATHLMGFFSTFNSDAIKDVNIYKGNMPAQYGGRLSSVLDIRTDDGSTTRTQVSGGIGIISSRLNVEGPIVKDRGSFSIHARRTYADLLLKLSNDSSFKDNKLNFYDLNAKASYQLGDRNKLYLSAYSGRDNLGLGNDFGLDWGNSIVSFRWNHVYNSSLFSNTSLMYSYYDYKVHIGSGSNDVYVHSSIQDFMLRNEWQWHISNDSKVNMGFSSVYHDIAPGQVEASANSSYNTQLLEKRRSLESALWMSHDWQFSRHWQVVYGARLSTFSVLGPGTFYDYDANGDEVDSSVFKWGDVARTYWSVEPRVALSYQWSDNDFLRFSYSRNTQNLHLLSNTTSGNPTDVWVPSSLNIKPEIGEQLALGYFGELGSGVFEYSSEIYYRWLENQIDYKNGAEIIANKDVESQLLYGKGRAYGWENYFKKKKGRLTGWISYTLSRSERQLDGINDGNWYPAKQDRTHEVSIVGMYRLNPKWTLSATWVYYTGNAVTFPSGKYLVNDILVNYYAERNGYRMPAYHRLDLGATLLGKRTKKFESSWTFSLFNAYGRENAYSLTFKRDPDDASKTVVERLALFRFVPSVTYNFKF